MEYAHKLYGAAILSVAAVVSTFLVACGGSEGPQETADVRVNLPSYAMVGEPFSLDLEFDPAIVPEFIFVNETYVLQADEPVNIVIKTPSDQTEQDCCDIRVRYTDARDNSRHERHFSIPAYGPVLYLGPPLTVKANSKQVILASVDEGLTKHLNDSVAAITWTQKAGQAATMDQSANFGRELHLDLPTVTDIEQLVFEASLTTTGGMTFTEEKTLFIVPESQWVEAVQIVQSDNRTMVLREDGTIAHFVRDIDISVQNTFYSTAPIEQVKKLSVNPSGRHGVDYLLAENGSVYWRRYDQPWQLLTTESERIIDISAIQLDARGGLNIILENGDVFWVNNISDPNFDKPPEATGAVKVTPSLSLLHYLSSDGELWSNPVLGLPKEYIATVKNLDLSAYISLDGRVYDLHTRAPLIQFDAFDDIVRIASSNLATSGLYVFAWRQSGEIVSNARLPFRDNIRDIRSGTDLHMALLNDGTVHMWQSLFNAQRNEQIKFLDGLEPSPFNLKAPD